MLVRNFLSAATVSALCLGSAAEAATVSIRATVLDGLYAGFSVVGVLGYDEEMAKDANLFSIGDEAALTPYSGAVTLSFDLGVMTLTEKNDAGYDGFPHVTFMDGVLKDINYWVIHGKNGANLLPYYVKEFEFGALVASATEENTYNVDVNVVYGDPSEVPLPAGLPLLGGGLVALGALRKRWRA